MKSKSPNTLANIILFIIFLASFGNIVYWACHFEWTAAIFWLLLWFYFVWRIGD